MCCNAIDVDAAIDTLLIGYGNTLRSDDGVGPVVVEYLRKSLASADTAGVVCRSEFQLTPELADLVARAGRVIFIDASVGLPPGRVSVRRVTAQAAAGSMGHQFLPAQLLELADLAFGARPQAWVAAIGVQSLAFGQGLTAPVAHAARRLTEHLRHYLSRQRRKSPDWYPGNFGPARTAANQQQCGQAKRERMFYVRR